MKNLAIMFMAVMALCGWAFQAWADLPIPSKAWENIPHSLKLIHVCDVTDGDLHEILSGNCSDVAVEFSAHTTLPMNFFLKGDLLNFKANEANNGVVEIMQTFYARYVDHELILSTNLIDWKPLFEFITGQASVSLSNQDGQPVIVIGAETYKRS